MDSIFQYHRHFFGDNQSEYGIPGYNLYIDGIQGTFGIHDYQKWIYSVIGCVLVGLSGVFPIFLFTSSETVPQSSGK